MEKAKLFGTIRERAKEFGLSKLSDKAGLSRQALNEMFKLQNPRFDSLDRVIEALGLKVELSRTPLLAHESIWENLRAYGAPLTTFKQNEVTPASIEATLAQGVYYARRDPILASVLPYVMFRQAEHANWGEVVTQVGQLGELRSLGYFAEVALAYRKNVYLNSLVQLLSPTHSEPEPLDKNEAISERKRKHYEKSNNHAAKRWGFLTNDDLNSHLERFKKWEALEENLDGRQAGN